MEKGNVTVRQNSRTEWVQSALTRYEKPLLHYAYHLTGNIETARDVVQDTFLKLCAADYRKINAYLAPWLYRVCRNRALDVMRKESRMLKSDDTDLAACPCNASPPGLIAVGHETESVVLKTLASLPENQQEVFRLKFQDQLSYKEISEVTNHTSNHVRYLIHVSLKQLREALRDQLEMSQSL